MKAIRNLIGALILDVINGIDTMIVDAVGILRNPGGWNDVWWKVIELSRNFERFCSVVIGICLMIEIAQVAAKVDTIKWEHGLKLCVKAALAKVAITIAPEFLRACYNQSLTWLNLLWNGGSSMHVTTGTYHSLNEALKKVDGLFSAIGLLATCLLAILAIKVCSLLVMVIAYGRMFEILVYLLISPLPFAFFPLGNGNGDGVSRITQRFVKSFIAVCLQGVMMLGCMRVFDAILGNRFDAMLAAVVDPAKPSVSVNNFCFTMLMGCIVLVMALSRCGTWSKGVVDAM